MEEWCAAGLAPDQFWIQTPRSLRAVMRGIYKRDEREMGRLAWLASRTGALAQVHPNKHPSIDKMLGRKPKGRPVQTVDERLAVFKALQAGGAPMTIRRID